MQNNSNISISKITQELLVINSSIYETMIFGYLVQLLQRLNFSVSEQYVENTRSNIFAIKNFRPDEKAILFYGHMDTVAPMEGWKTDPFTPP